MRNKLAIVLIVATSLYAFVYWMVDWPFALLNTKSVSLLNSSIWKTAFLTHITFSGIALGIGWANFNSNWRNKYMNTHRLLGKLYVLAVLLGGVSGLYIALHATGGWIATAGFQILAMIWLYTTVRAFVTIKAGYVAAHERWMIFSYSLTCAAVTLRMYLPVLSALLGDFVKAYQIVAWLCWVPNIAWAVWYTNRASPDFHGYKSE